MVVPVRWWQEVNPASWRAFGLPDDLDRERYTATLAAMEALSTRAPMSTLAEIADQLRGVGYFDAPPLDVIRSTLDQLVAWGLLEPFRDYAAVMTSLQAVRLRQEAWALTQLGRGVVTAVRTAVLDADRALQLPARLLDGVERTVRDLLAQFGNDHGLLPTTLDDVRSRIEELQRVTADFYAALAQLVQADVTQDEMFGSNRDRVVEALRQFPQQYDRALRRVESALADLNKLGPRVVVETASEYAGLLDARDTQQWVDERVRRLSDLQVWFSPGGTIARLIENASGAVGTVLIAIDRRYSAKRRGSDIGADFRALAYSLQAQDNEDDARGVWVAAFGDWPAVHPRVGASAEDMAVSTEARNGPSSHAVEVTLREHERVGAVGGRPHKVPDSTAARQAQLIAALHELTLRRRYAAMLATDGPVGLDHFTDLPSDAAAILLRAVQEALMKVDPRTGWGQAVAEHAAAVVRARPAAHGARVVIALREGTLEGPAVTVEVRPQTVPDATSSSEVGTKSDVAGIEADRTHPPHHSPQHPTDGTGSSRVTAESAASGSEGPSGPSEQLGGVA